MVKVYDADAMGPNAEEEVSLLRPVTVKRKINPLILLLSLVQQQGFHGQSSQQQYP